MSHARRKGFIRPCFTVAVKSPTWVRCPSAPRCGGVLRYDLAARIDGYVAQCEARDADTSWAYECGFDFCWDAVSEEWKLLMPEFLPGEPDRDPDFW